MILPYFLIISLYQSNNPLGYARGKQVYRPLPQKPSSRYKINEQIKALEVRVIDIDGQNLGLLKTSEAIGLAKEKGVDLVEIVQTPKETVARITDLGKFLYQQEKAAKKNKEKQSKNTLKGIRLKLMIQPHDMQTKAKQAERFLTDGHNIRVDMFLRGRERVRVQEAEKKLLGFVSSISIKTKIIQQGRGPRGPQVIISKG